ncbi:MAG: hypothetical protein RBS39_05780 [Phycisphaerales bacterium]|jgi:hypothetical protein|nr:hypothetical protein [Phycisphaerales bacterium]
MNARYGPVFSQYADFGESAPMVPARTSVLAIVALVFAVPCVITGPIGLILGGLALLLIALSRGRVRGVGLAVAATVLGLLGTVAQVALVWGAVQGVQFMVAPAARVMAAADANDIAGVQGELFLGVRPMVTPESLDAFRTAYQAQVGAFVSAPQGIFEYARQAENLGQGWNQFGSSQRQNEIPIPCEFSNGRALVLLALPQRNVTNPKGLPLTDVGVSLPDGTDIWLIGGSSPNQDGQPLGATPPSAPQAPGAPPSTPAGSGDATDDSSGGD